MALTRLNTNAYGSTVNLASNVTGTLANSNLAAGNVIQVVSAVTDTGASNTTTTYADTGLTATITPSATSSKVLIIFVHNGVLKRNVGTGLGVNIGLFKASSQLDTVAVEAGWNNLAQWNDIGAVGASYLDSPSTTSATVYKTQFKCQNTTGTVNINNASAGSYITLMEIAG